MQKVQARAYFPTTHAWVDLHTNNVKKNKWRQEEEHLVLPPLPLRLRGRHGCFLHSAVFDWRVGEEVYLTFREEPAASKEYADVQALTVTAEAGLVRTPHGMIGCIIWQIAVGTPLHVAVDQHLNPHNRASVKRVADAASQTHLKFAVLNSTTGEATVFTELENNFALCEVAAAMAEIATRHPPGDFLAASQYVAEEFGAEHLLFLGLRTSA